MNPSTNTKLTDTATDINALPLQVRADMFRKMKKNELLNSGIDPNSTIGRQFLQQVEDRINREFQTQNITSGAITLTPEFVEKNPQLGNQLIGQGIEVSPAKTTEEKTREAGRKELIVAAKDALKTLEEKSGVSATQRRSSKKNVSGFAPSLLRPLREMFGFIDPDSQEVNTKFADVASTLAFSIGGKQFTQTELELIEPLLPRIWKDESVNRTNLVKLIDILDRQLGTKQPENNLSADDEALIQKYKNAR